MNPAAKPKPAPDPEIARARALRTLLGEAPGGFRGPADLARRCRLDPEELVAFTRCHFHGDPGPLLERARIESVRRALDGGAAFEEAWGPAGFSGERAARRAFLAHHALEPEAWVELGRRDGFELCLPRGYRVEAVLGELGRNPSSPCEARVGLRFSKGLVLDGRVTRLSLEFGRGSVVCRLEGRRAASPEALRGAHGAAIRLLGLASNPRPFEAQVARIPRLAGLIEGRHGLRIPLTADPFEGLVWVVVGQQVNLAFAFACRGRLVELCGRRAGAGLLAHPTAAEVAHLDYADLTRLQFSRRKSEYLIDSSRRIVEGRLDLAGLALGSALEAQRTLLAVRGLGPWSVQYLLMRSYGLADCVPLGDAGLSAALRGFFGLAERPDPARTLELMEPFAPRRSLATFHLWKWLAERAPAISTAPSDP